MIGSPVFRFDITVHIYIFKLENPQIDLNRFKLTSVDSNRLRLPQIDLEDLNRLEKTQIAACNHMIFEILKLVCTGKSVSEEPFPCSRYSIPSFGHK